MDMTCCDDGELSVLFVTLSVLPVKTALDFALSMAMMQ